MNRIDECASRFMEDRNSTTDEENFELFCDAFGVSDSDAKAFFSGKKFVLADKKPVSVLTGYK